MNDQPCPDRERRIPLAELRQQDLDLLYNDLDRYDDAIGELNETNINMARDLAALRAVARGYCPHCGRGDAAPTIEDWEQQKQRADKAERERDTARQHAAAIAAQRDRLRQRMNTLADRWDYALAVDKPYARTLRAEISCAPFHPDANIVVRQYRADDGSQKWAVRCWGTDTCDGFLSLDHDTERWAEQARDRHVAEAHGEPVADGHQRGDRAEATLASVRELARNEQDNGNAIWPDDLLALLDEPTASPSLREQVTALRDDLRGITGARWIADALDNILDGQPANLRQQEPR